MVMNKSDKKLIILALILCLVLSYMVYISFIQLYQLFPPWIFKNAFDKDLIYDIALAAIILNHIIIILIIYKIIKLGRINEEI